MTAWRMAAMRLVMLSSIYLKINGSYQCGNKAKKAIIGWLKHQWLKKAYRLGVSMAYHLNESGACGV